jgi:hypothetical protein
LLYRDCFGLAHRVCFEDQYLGFDLDFLNVHH